MLHVIILIVFYGRCESLVPCGRVDGWLHNMTISVEGTTPQAGSGGVVIARGLTTLVDGGNGASEATKRDVSSRLVSVAVLSHWPCRKAVRDWLRTVGLHANRKNGTRVVVVDAISATTDTLTGDVGSACAWWNNEQRNVLAKQAPELRAAIPEVWTPAQRSAVHCSLCEQVFNMAYRRRHRCHCCAKVVCGNCSKHRSYSHLKSNGAPGRVCDNCHYAVLGGGEGSHNAPPRIASLARGGATETGGDGSGSSVTRSITALSSKSGSDVDVVTAVVERTPAELVEISPLEQLRLDSAMTVYFKMVAVKVPVPCVVTKMRTDGIDEAQIRIFAEGYGVEAVCVEGSTTSITAGITTSTVGTNRGHQPRMPHIPGVKLKRVHCAALEGDRVAGSVWDGASTGSILRALAPVQVQASEALEITKLFGTPMKAKYGKLGGGKKAKLATSSCSTVTDIGRKLQQEKTEDEITRAKMVALYAGLLDSKREMNVGIGLASQFSTKTFPSPAHVIAAINDANGTILTVDRLQSLLEMLPKDSEVKKIERLRPALSPLLKRRAQALALKDTQGTKKHKASLSKLGNGGRSDANRLAKYAKMRKVLVPEGSIRLKMQAEGVSTVDIEAFFATDVIEDAKTATNVRTSGEKAPEQANPELNPRQAMLAAIQARRAVKAKTMDIAASTSAKVHAAAIAYHSEWVEGKEAASFMVEVTKHLPRARKKVQALLLHRQFDDRVEYTRNRASILTRACQQVVSCSELSRLLEIILQLTRYINKEVDSNGAPLQGLTLGSLSTLSRMKGIDGSGRSLLDYTAQLARSRGEQVLNVAELLREALAPQALQLSQWTVRDEYRQLCRELQMAQREGLLGLREQDPRRFTELSAASSREENKSNSGPEEQDDAMQQDKGEKISQCKNHSANRSCVTTKPSDVCEISSLAKSGQEREQMKDESTTESINQTNSIRKNKRSRRKTLHFNEESLPPAVLLQVQNADVKWLQMAPGADDNATDMVNKIESSSQDLPTPQLVRNHGKGRRRNRRKTLQFKQDSVPKSLLKQCSITTTKQENQKEQVRAISAEMAANPNPRQAMLAAIQGKQKAEVIEAGVGSRQEMLAGIRARGSSAPAEEATSARPLATAPRSSSAAKQPGCIQSLLTDIRAKRREAPCSGENEAQRTQAAESSEHAEITGLVQTLCTGEWSKRAKKELRQLDVEVRSLFAPASYQKLPFNILN